MELVADRLVSDCLRSEDSAVRSKALEVLQLLANESNVKDICDNLVKSLRSDGTSSQEQKRALIGKTLGLLDKFDSAPLDWKVFVLVRLLQNSHGPQREGILLKIKQSLASGDEQCAAVGRKLTDLMAKIVAESTNTSPAPQVRNVPLKKSGCIAGLLYLPINAFILKIQGVYCYRLS